jgi:hypothetical protein
MGRSGGGVCFLFRLLFVVEGRMIFLEKIFSFARNFEGKTARLKPIAFENDYHGVVFNVLGWNKPAIGFYQAGAEFWSEWKTVGLRRRAP